MRVRAARVAFPLAAILIYSTAADAQVFVRPRRPNKSQVRHFEFEWQHIDILVGRGADTSEAEGADPGATQKEPEVSAGGEEAGGMLDGSETQQASGTPEESGPPEAAETQEGSDAPEASDRPEESDAPEASEPQDASEPSEDEASEPTEIPAPTPRGESAVEGESVAEGEPTPAPAEVSDEEKLDLKPPEPAPKLRGWARFGDRTGGVRLYFYSREREVAERAAGFIQRSYRYLVDKFDYVPTQTFPYILYNTYQEFLETNLFPLQEGVLGVTSPRDLKLTLPYFGDHRLFDEVGTHELVHQFTIQKVRTIADKAELWADPLEGMPLWFIEGLAEYYAKRGIDPEAEMLVRDILVNPKFREGYVMLDFFEDRPFSVLWTYKVGQVRCAFLEETYGENTLQKIIEESPRLVGNYQGSRQLAGFAELLQHVTGEEPTVLSAKFEDWLKRRSYRTYLGAHQDASQLKVLTEIEGRVNALNASPDGNLLMYRTIDLDTGQSRLVLVDPRDTSSKIRVAADGTPGVESLHPVSSRNFDLTGDALVFVAESRGRDLLYRQEILHTAEKRTHNEPDAEEPRGRGAKPRQAGGWKIELALGRRIAWRLGPRGILAVESPTFSPDGRRVAFIGLDEQGTKDVYTLTPGEGDEDFVILKLTDDIWAERELAWGPGGIVYTSDATSHSKYNLFRIDPEAPDVVERLTTEARDHFDPLVLEDGRILFTAYGNGRADVHEVVDGKVVRRTDVDTGLFDLSPGPDGGLWALWHHGGQRRPASLAKDKFVSLDETQVAEAAPPRKLPHRSLAGATAYDALTLKNWELGNLFGFFGAGSGGVFGQLLATSSDRLRNHSLILNLFVLGSVELTDGYLVYINQMNRITWGTGLFQSLVFRTDQTPELAAVVRPFSTVERFFGALGSLRYPFNTYQHAQVDLSVGGVQYFLTDDAIRLLGDGDLNGTRRNLIPTWEDANAGARLQAEVTGRLGYDTIRYHRATGPLAGNSLMLEGTLSVQPFDGQVFGNLRLDGEQYLSLWGRTNVFLRMGAGTTFGGRFARQFFLYSFDTLRGVPFGDSDRLRGRHFFFSTAELQFPLNAIIRLILFTDIEGILGVDFGGVGDDLDALWDNRVLSVVLGLNFGFGPLVFRLHFAKPVDIKGGSAPDVPNDGGWVTNFSLGWIYY